MTETQKFSETKPAQAKPVVTNTTIQAQVQVEEVGEDGLTYTQRSKFFMDELKSLKDQQRMGGVIAGDKSRQLGDEDYTAFVNNKEGDRKELDNFVNSQIESGRNNISLIMNMDERKTAVKRLKEKKLTNAQKIVKYMKGKSYFRTLFPSIKEQKPGVDFYARITFWQFIICLYLINFYTILDARGTQILENTNQFSINMVIILFI